jgi:hypothetical protein
VQQAQTANASFRLNTKRRKFPAGWQLVDLESFCTNANEMRGRVALGGICALYRVAPPVGGAERPHFIQLH